MPQGFALESASSVEVIAAYSAPHTAVLAVASAPGWYVVGAFYLPKAVRARLDAMITISSSGLTCTVRLYDMHAKAAVSGATVSTTSQALERKLSGMVTLPGNRLYQIQAQCIGTVGDQRFAVIENATITD